MIISTSSEGSTTEIVLEGRIDSNTSQQFHDDLAPYFESATEVTLDFTKVEYISSAGLRVLLTLLKSMPNGGKLNIAHANELVREVFSVTGISALFNLI